MNVQRTLLSATLVPFLSLPVLAQVRGGGCTSAVVSTEATADGTPILWKNRDTSVLSNKVVYVRDQPYGYLALVNADSPSGRHAFAGLNAAGFAIMNTVAYNLPEEAEEMKDLEGIMMADALRTCASVEEFERYIGANLGPDLGSLANFGVFDSAGRAFLFEIHNHGYEKYDAAALPERYIVNTNFARSGSPADGEGYLRFERANQLFRDLGGGKISVRDILRSFTRDFGHVLLRHPGLSELGSLPANEELWISTRDCIDRTDTSAAVVFVGRNPREPDSVATMWVIPGEPLTAVAIPLWVEARRSPEPLWLGEEAPLWQESMRIKRLARPFEEGHKGDYLRLTRLDNADGTGFLPVLLRAEEEILRSTAELLTTGPTPEELAHFQEEIAARVLATLKSIR